jgi:mxaJ protein
MRSHCRSVAAVALGLALASTAFARPALRVCADPSRMPFSSRTQEGFENRIAAVVADELGSEVEYTWRPSYRGFLRDTLVAGECDVVPGIPTATDRALVTAPYYRSSYVFVGRHGAEPIASFDDPRLRTLRIGVPLLGDDYANPPPVHALAARGIVGRLHGYRVYGSDPLGAVVDAVADEVIDVAIVWGPVGGWYAARRGEALDVVPVHPQIDLPFLPMVFDVSMGVRRDDTALRDRLDAALAGRRAEIDAILAAYAVPRLDVAPRAARAPAP